MSSFRWITTAQGTLIMDTRNIHKAIQTHAIFRPPCLPLIRVTSYSTKTTWHFQKPTQSFPYNFATPQFRPHITASRKQQLWWKKTLKKKQLPKSSKIEFLKTDPQTPKKERKQKKNTMKKLPSSLHLHSSPKSRRNSPSLPASKALNSKASRRRRRQPPPPPPPPPPRLSRLGQPVKTAGA